MRIAQIVPSLEIRHGGPSVSVPKLASALVFAGHSVELLSTDPEGDSSQHNEGDLLRINFKRDWPEKIRSSRDMRAHLSSRDYDLIHSHALWIRTTHYAHQCAKRLGVPHVISPRGMMHTWALNHHSWRKRFASWFIHPGALSSASGWHATSSEEANDLHKAGFRQPVCVAPNGVDTPSDAQVASSSAFWREHCPEAFQRPTALFYSRFHRKKRVLELIELWAARAPSDWFLLMVGIPQEYSVQELQDFVLRNSASDRILIFDGKDAPPPYAAASLFLLPSHSENFGLVVAEALAWGVPVVVTDSTPWGVINRTPYGWCCPWERYPHALGAALALGPAALRARGSQAVAWVSENYSWSKTAATLSQFYSSLKA